MKIVFLNGLIMTEGFNFVFEQDPDPGAKQCQLKILSHADNRVRINVKDRLVVIDTWHEKIDTYTPVVNQGVSEPTNIDGGLKDGAFHWERMDERRDFTSSVEPLTDFL